MVFGAMQAAGNLQRVNMGSKNAFFLQGVTVYCGAPLSDVRGTEAVCKVAIYLCFCSGY